MPNINKQVQNLNTDVMNALKAVKNPQNATVAEVREIRTAILKDGTIDSAEQDLIDELTEDNAKGIQISASGSAAPSISLSALSDDGQDAIGISLLALGKRKGELLYQNTKSKLTEVYQDAREELTELQETMGEKFDDFLTEGREFMTELFTFQYAEGTKSEQQANCGPSSASMIIKGLGIEPPPLADLRKMTGAPTGNGRGAFAMSTGQLESAVVRTAAQYGLEVTAKTEGLSTNVDTALAAIKKKLDAGEKVVLLSSNIMVQSGSRGKGHYVVVKDILPNGSLVVDDPQSPPERGLSRTHSKAEFANALRRRVNFGRANEIISFKAPEVAPITA
jgi:hypothetical protein